MTRFLFALALTLGLTACDLAAVGTAVDDFNIILGIDSQSTVVGGLVVDAATGDLVEGAVAVTFAPSVPGAVVDGFGDPVAGVTVEGGAFNFAVSDDVMPSDASPVRVAVTVRAPGYLAQRRVIALADTGSYGMTVSLLSPSRPPSGSGSGSASGSSDGGAGTAAPVTASATSDDGGSATAEVAQGTVFTDAGGQPLSGALEVEVTTVSPGTPAFEAVPALDDGHAAVAAFQVSASAGGRSAASAGTAVAVSVTVPAGVLDPATGRPFVPGDRVDAVAFDADAGEWVPAGTGVVVAAGGNGRRSGTTIKGSTSRMSAPHAYSRSGVASQRVTVRVERNGNEGALTARAVTASNTVEGVISAGRSEVVLEVPAGAERRETGVVLHGTFYAAAPADCVDCVVSLPASSGPVRVTVTPTCADPSERVYVDDMPTYTVSAREHGSARWFGVTGRDAVSHRDDGSLESLSMETTALRPGASYDTRTTYLDDTYEGTYDVPASGDISEALEAPNSMCQ